MEIPERLYNWLRQTGIFTSTPTIKQGKVLLQEEDSLHLENGIAFVKLLERLHTAFHELEPFHMPELNDLEDSSNRNAKLHNWNILTKALEHFGIHLDSNLKTLIVAGDQQLVLELTKDIQQMENLALGRETEPLFDSPQRKRKKRVNIKGALLLSNLNPHTLLSEAESSLEFLLLSLCHNLSVTPKQAAGLLTQGGKYLELIVVKGLRGDFEPVLRWYSALIENMGVLARCIENEIASGALGLVLDTLETGLASLDVRVIALACDSLKTVHSLLKFQENDIWEWFLGNDVFRAVMRAYETRPNDLAQSVFAFLYELGRKRLIQIFGEMLLEYYGKPAEYFATALSCIQVLVTNPWQKEHMESQGLVLHWMEQGLRECSRKQSVSDRLAAILFLCEVWLQFSDYIDSHESLANRLLTELNKVYKDKSKLLKIVVIGKLFQVLSWFLQHGNLYSSILYKSLVFALVEHIKLDNVREFILVNFAQLMAEGGDFSLMSLLDPLVKHFHNATSFNPSDFDFLLACANYPGLELKQASGLIEFLGKVYIQDLRYSNGVSIPLVRLIGRFGASPAIQQQIIQILMNGFGRVMQQAKPLPLRSGLEFTAEDRELIFARNLLLSLVEKCIKLDNAALVSLIQELLLTAGREAKRTNARLTNGINNLLSMTGFNSNLSVYSLVSTHTDRIGTPRSRAISHIEQLTQNRKNLELKRQSLTTQNELESLKKKSKLKKAVAAQMMAHGIDSKFSETSPVLKKSGIPRNEPVFVEPEEESEFDQDLLYVVLKRYSRAIKALFNQYSDAWIQQSPMQRDDFERHHTRVIKEGAAMKMFRDFRVTKSMINPDQIRTVYTYVRKKYKAVHLAQESFANFLYHVSQTIFRGGSDHDLSHFPPAISLQGLFEYFSQAEILPKHLLEEPDAGAGDREVVALLNAKIEVNPDTKLPEGYKRVKDYKISVEYHIPDEVDVPESTLIALEVLDDVLNTQLGIHILEPVVSLADTYRVKGLLNKPQVQHTDEHYSTPITVPGNRAGYKVLPLPTYFKVTPSLKLEVTKLGEQYPHSLLLECARAIDDLVHSVHEISPTVISRNPKPSQFLENTVKKEKAKEERFQNALRRKSEQKRQQRVEELKAELHKHHTLKEQQRKEEESRRQAEEAARVQKMKEINLVKEKAMRELMKKRKNKNSVIPSDLFEASFFTKERKKLFMYNQKRREELEKTRPKQRHRWPARNKYSLVKILQPKIMEKAIQLKDSWEAWEDPQVKEIIKKYKFPILTLYATYTRQKVEAIAPQAFLLKLNEFSRLFAHLNIVPALITPEMVQQIFNSLAKKSSDSFLGLNLSAFKRALVKVAIFSKEKVNQDLDRKTSGPPATSVQNLFDWLCLPLDQKAARDFVRGIEDNVAILNPRDKKKMKNELVKQLASNKT